MPPAALSYLVSLFQTTTGRAGLGGHEVPVQAEVRDEAVPWRSQPPPGSGTAKSHQQLLTPGKGLRAGAGSFAHGQQGNGGDGEIAAGGVGGREGSKARGQRVSIDIIDCSTD